MKGARTVPEDIRTFAQAMHEEFLLPELQALGDRVERLFKEQTESLRHEAGMTSNSKGGGCAFSPLSARRSTYEKVAKAPTLDIDVEPVHVLAWRDKRVEHRKSAHTASLAMSERQLQVVQSNLSRHEALLSSPAGSPRGARGGGSGGGDGEILAEPLPVGTMSWLPGGWLQHFRKNKAEEHWQKEESQFRAQEESGNFGRLCCSADLARDRQEPHHDWRQNHHASWLDRLVRNPVFTNTVFALVVLNALIIGIQVDYTARHWLLEAPTAFVMVDRAFCAIFCLEIGLRMWVYGFIGFLTMPGWEWNVFESAVVATQVTEHLIHIFMHKHRIWRWVACIRTFRLIRIVRVATVFHRVQHLRMLLVSVSASFKSLGWVLGLLVFMTYAVACYITQLVTEHKVQHLGVLQGRELQAGSEEEAEAPSSARELLELYGSLDRSVFALYMMLSEGTHWGELVAPLSAQISPWSRLTFFFFSGFAIFAVLNVITGVFVESAIKTANEDKKHMLVKQIRILFQRADLDGSGELSWAEFEEQLESHDMQLFFKEIDVDPEDAKEVFRLLDIDSSGTVNQEEMVHGMSKLMGEAKSIDLATLTHEFAQSQVRWVDHAKWVESTLLLLFDSASTADVRPPH